MKCSVKAHVRGVASSRPVWARGLKLISAALAAASSRSRPVWARGLKYLLRLAVGLAEAVASRVGAGIEMYPAPRPRGREIGRVPCGRGD